MEAQFPPLRTVFWRRQRLVDVEQARPRLEASGAVRDTHDAVEAGHVEDDAAGERHRLTVVAGAAAAHRQRHAVAGAGRGDADDLVTIARHRHEIGALIFKQRFQDRREPEEVAALELQRRRIVGKRNAAEIGLQRVQGFHSRAGSNACTSAHNSTKARA